MWATVDCICVGGKSMYYYMKDLTDSWTCFKKLTSAIVVLIL